MGKKKGKNAKGKNYVVATNADMEVEGQGGVAPANPSENPSQFLDDESKESGASLQHSEHTVPVFFNERPVP
jgi:hypothetical protein